jgi:hypothetical protein
MPFRNKHPMGTFRRGLAISPFQIPLLAYLCAEGFLVLPQADAMAREFGLQHSWSVWWFALLLIIGSGLATFSRFNANERLEEFSLILVGLAIIVAVGIQVIAKQYSLGDEAAILLGCWFRIRVLRSNRKAEKLAIQIATDSGETTN